MRLKKRFTVCALVVILLAIIGQSTLAYYTSSDQAHNVITTSGVEITLLETIDDKDTAFVDLYGVMPGQVVPKIVAVRNDEEEAFIRIQCDVIMKDASGKEMELSQEKLESLISVDYNEEAWTLKDGWWYFGESVATGERTVPLFTAVEFNGRNMTNEYQNCSVQIRVYAQAVQVKNNPGTTALTAQGWPKA